MNPPALDQVNILKSMAFMEFKVLNLEKAIDYLNRAEENIR
jgi:hypothetical protein